VQQLVQHHRLVKLILNSNQETAISNRSLVRVLVVDDFAPWQRFVLEKIQENRNLRVIDIVSDGLEAVLKAAALRPDLILLDVGLPNLDGIKAAQRILKVAPESKILFVSENLDPDVAQAALAAGGDGYVVKSDAARDLLTAVKVVMSGKKFVSRRIVGCTLAGAGDSQAGAKLRREEFIAPAHSRSEEIDRCHEVQFYGDDASFLDGFTSFVCAALKAGNAAIVVATESHRDSLLRRLQEHGLDIHAALNEGRYTALDAAGTLSTFMVNDLPDPVRFSKIVGDLIMTASKAAKGEHPRVAACGECAPLLWAQGKADAAIQLEHLCHEIAKTYDVDILCGYLLETFQHEPDRQIYKKICAEHSAVTSKLTAQ
jgi:DNA-binding NarL/FixJ family response regulator